jgi:carnitine O-acetyltransferase
MFATTPYRASQPRTFSLQKQLPRLPVPTLSNSLDRYIRSLKPLLLEQARKEGKAPEWVEQELEKRRSWGRDFEQEGGLGKVLQERLKGTPVFSPFTFAELTD